ncbi:purine-binding chemotaxis protein CheW [Crassaminicella thermophila]|uniref:Chemotaxis protein CheW n=1 Tax=Crassaminicella thermophila TaxID=2599308 RepID=A0A5C0SAD4_CRATE|nr:chemotaxis protein CheW [Crassaminicella thermophila]QEK10947.1 purine-binding chemotaxis protein CheW [Crassaminicella thermophila]
MAEKQYVIFKLGREEYGIDIMNVREITEFKETTKIPNAPNFIEGVINLRGNVIPVINLKKRFKLDETNIANNSRIIIVTMDAKQIGFIVDDASQVMTLNEDEIENPPEIITGIDRKYIVGIGKMDEKIIILLDLVAVFSDEEKNQIVKMDT